MPKNKLYSSYENFKLRCKNLVNCPLCNHRDIPLKSYQQHCLMTHNLNHKKCCVYCFGKVKWSQGQKMTMGAHLGACCRKFEKIYRSSSCNGDDAVAAVSDPSASLSDAPNNSLNITDAQSITSPMQLPSVALICSKQCFTFGSFESCQEKFWNKWPIEDQEGARLMEEPLFESNVESLNFTESDVMHKYEAATKDKEKWLALLNPLRFDRLSGLADVPSWIYRYLFTSWSTSNEKHRTWYHLCVRAGCMKSFVEAVKDLDIVAAPYWCVCDGGVKFDQQESLAKTHHRHFIVAVKNQAKFHNALRRNVVFEGSGPPPEPGFKKYYAKLIKTANHFVATVAYVSLPHSKCRCKDLMNKGEGREEDSDNPVLTFWRGYSRGPRHEGHYLVRNKVVWHALWWLLLLIPSEGIDKFAQFCISQRSVFGMKSRRFVGNRWMLSAVDELQVQNCVVRFNPPNIKIDTDNPIDNLKNYLDMPTWLADGSPYEERRPFVYWFDGKIFPVKRMDLPEFDDEEKFQLWHATKGINTLLNLGCDSLFRMPFKLVRHANDLEEMRKECTTFNTTKLIELKANYEENELDLQRSFDETKGTWLRMTEEKEFEIRQLRDETQKIQDENQKLRDEMQILRDEMQILRDELKTEKQNHISCRKELDKATKKYILSLEKQQLEKCTKEKEKLKVYVKSLRRKIETLQQRLRRFEKKYIK